MGTLTINELAGRLFDAKREEEEAKQARIYVEEQIAALVETPESGSKTVDAGNGLKLTVKRSLNYKADMDGIITLDGMVANLPIKTKREFDAKAYEEIREKSPKDFALLAKHVSVTPAKTSVTLKLA